jgi:hypothetical protein
LFHKSYKNKKSFYQYFWIKNLNNIKNEIKKSYVCTICYNRFGKAKTLNRHLLICNSLTEEVYPSKNAFLSFDEKKAAKYASPLTIIGFADFEAKLAPIAKNNYKGPNDLNNEKSFTLKKDIHSIVSFSLIFVDTDGKLVFEKCYCGDNADEIFLDTLDKIEEIFLINICKNKKTYWY